MVLGFLHGVWVRLADDVSEVPVGSIFTGQVKRIYIFLHEIFVLLDLEDGTDQEFRNVGSQPQPHAV
jgi:hypothetical protein